MARYALLAVRKGLAGHGPTPPLLSAPCALQKLDPAFAARSQGAAPQFSRSQSMHSRHTAATTPSGPSEAARSLCPSDRGGPAEEGSHGTNIKLELKNLSLNVPDPFAPLHKMWADELAAAQAAGQPVAFTLLPPPQPCVYHFELQCCKEDAAADGHDSEGHRPQLQQPCSAAGAAAPPWASDVQGPGHRDQGNEGHEASLEGEAGSRRSTPVPSDPGVRASTAGSGGGGGGGSSIPGALDQGVAGLEGKGGASEADAGQGSQAGPGVQGSRPPTPPCAAPPQQLQAERAPPSTSLPRDTTVLASIPLVLQPPEPPLVEPDAPSKVRGWRACCTSSRLVGRAGSPTIRRGCPVASM